MRRALLVASLLFATRPGWAQVTVNPHALDQLGAPPMESAEPPAREAPSRHHPTRGRRIPPHHPASASSRSTRMAAPARPPPATPAAAAPPTVPPAPPPVAVLAPPVPQAPPHPNTPPPLPTVVANAPGTATKIDSGIRITFGPGSANLNPGTEAALRVLGHTGTGDPNVVFNVMAYAPGKPDDPSTPRRLSLSRALAARSVLVNEGIPSMRIYVRALGANGIGDAPADRVDVTIAAANSPATPVTARKPP